MQNYVNIVLSSKGGVGKTMVASYLYEFLTASKKQPCIFIDTDTANKDMQLTAYYKALQVDFKDASGTITPKNVSVIAERYGDNNLVIDVGANSYYPWIKYLSEMDGVDELQVFGSKVLIHAVLVGGPQYNECLLCLKEILSLNLQCDVIVHLNNGYAENDSCFLPSPQDLIVSPDFAEIKDQIKAFVNLPQCSTVNRTLVEKLKNYHIALSELADATAKKREKLIEVFGDEKILIVNQHRAISYRTKIFDALKSLDFLYDIE